MQICQEGNEKSSEKKNKEQRALGLRGALSLDKFPRIGYPIRRKAGSLHESVMKNAASNIRFLSHRQRPELKPGERRTALRP